MHAAVIGAGVMGSGIAQWLSSRGVTVILRDVSIELLDRGLARIEKTYGEAVKRGLMSEEKAKEGRSRIVASSNPGPMREVQIVIEAASEKLEIKRAIFHDIDAKIDDTDILATNTSALSISDLAAQTKHPGRVIGLHFFNPVSRMKLIEVVIGKQTSDETKGARALLCPADRQAAGGRQGQPWVSGQSRSLSRICSMRRSFSSRESRLRKRSTPRWWSGGCRWGRCV